MCKAKQILSLLSTLLLFSFATIAMDQELEPVQDNDAQQPPSDGVVDGSGEQEQDLGAVGQEGDEEPKQQPEKTEPKKEHKGGEEGSPIQQGKKAEKDKKKKKCTIQ